VWPLREKLPAAAAVLYRPDGTRANKIVTPSLNILRKGLCKNKPNRSRRRLTNNRLFNSLLTAHEAGLFKHNKKPQMTPAAFNLS